MIDSEFRNVNKLSKQNQNKKAKVLKSNLQNKTTVDILRFNEYYMKNSCHISSSLESSSNVKHLGLQ